MAIISLGIGQGEIGITPLQLANLAALISHRGFLLHSAYRKSDREKRQPE